MDAERKFLHDLASPLSSALFLTEILNGSVQSAEQKELIKKMSDVLMKMQGMLNARRSDISVSELKDGTFG